MKKMVLGLAVLVGLVCAEELTQNPVIRGFYDGCKSGNSMALGEAYLFNYFDSQDYAKAKIYFEKVCKKGNKKRRSLS